MPGIQIHAAVADDVLSQRFLKPTPDWVRIVAVMSVALMAGLFATLLPAWWATAAVAVGIVTFWYFSVWLFGRGIWLNATQPFFGAFWSPSTTARRNSS